MTSVNDARVSELLGYVRTLLTKRPELSTHALSRALRVSHSHVNNIMAGRSRPSLTLALRLVEYLDGDVDAARELWRRDKADTTLVSSSKADLIIALLHEIRTTVNRLEEQGARDSRG